MTSNRGYQSHRTGRLVGALLLVVLSGCGRCGSPSSSPPGGLSAGSPPASTPAPAGDEAELAVLEGSEPSLSATEGAPPPIQAFVSREGTAGAFVVKTMAGAKLVKGRTSSPEYPGIERLVFSPDGRRAAFVVPAEGKERLVLDGVLGPPFDAIGDLLFTRDGKHLFQTGQGEGAWFMVIDGKRGEPRQHFDVPPRLGKDGVSAVLIEKVTTAGPSAIVSYDGAGKRTVLKELAAARCFLSDDGARAAGVVAAGDKWKVISFSLASPGAVTEGELFDDIRDPCFSPDGGHVMYGARRGEQAVIVLDGRSEPLPAGAQLIEDPVHDPAGGGVGLVLSDGAMGQESVFFHLAFGKGQVLDQRRKYTEIRGLVFSPAGSRHAYAAESGRSVVVVNGIEGPAFDKVVAPVFSPDSHRLVYRARQDGQRFLVIADADGKILRKLPPHQEVFRPTFSADGREVVFGVRDGGRLLQAVEKL